MRILIAGFLGSIAMFAWMSIAHMATPLSSTGFSQIPNEAPVLQAMESSIAKPGLYIYPWTDPKDPAAMAKMQAAEKAHGHGLLLYTPANGARDESMAPMLIQEYLKEFVQALIASFIVAGMGAASFARRWGTVVLIGVTAAIATNISYWTWYHFPLDFTLAAIFMEIVSGVVAGLPIAWWLGRTRRA
ncbi:MAG TPA: hypothetical protein VGF56_07340 [Rhizomicrobium sp.]|jgi:hypothetical protein